MTHALIISSLLSWAITLMLILAVWALARQVGLLHERIQPVGALSLGKAIKAGDAAPVFTLASLTGGSVSLGGASGQATLLFFLSETCPVCKTLLPVLDALRRQERLHIVLASDGEPGEHLAFIAAQGSGSRMSEHTATAKGPHSSCSKLNQSFPGTIRQFFLPPRKWS